MAKSKNIKYKNQTLKNMTVKEASEFLDKKSFFDFKDIKEVKFNVDIKGEKHYILLESDVAKKVQILSRKNRQSQHRLVNSLLKKSLEQIA